MTTAQIPTPSEAGSGIATRDRLPSLTGLRFWAALLVVLYHLSHQVGEVPLLSPMVQFGRTGVTFFFVLSGFVLAWTYLDRPTRFATFIWRRFARIWPLVLVTGLLSLAAFAVLGVHIPLWQAVTTPLFLQAWHPDWAVGANGAAWSLSDEAFFYLLFPAILLVAASAVGRKWLWVAIGALTPAVWLAYVIFDWSNWAIDYLPLTRALQFMLGVACAVAMRRGVRAPMGYWPAVALVVIFHGALVPWMLATRGVEDQWGPYSGSQWWAAPVFALLIMAAAQSDQEGKFTAVQGAWSLKLGHWSYAWYLIHEVVVRLWVFEVGRPAGLEILAHWIALLVLSLAAAWVLYACIEHPSERWLRSRGPQ